MLFHKLLILCIIDVFKILWDIFLLFHVYLKQADKPTHKLSNLYIPGTHFFSHPLSLLLTVYCILLTVYFSHINLTYVQIGLYALFPSILICDGCIHMDHIDIHVKSIHDVFVSF